MNDLGDSGDVLILRFPCGCIATWEFHDRPTGFWPDQSYGAWLIEPMCPDHEALEIEHGEKSLAMSKRRLKA